MSEINEIDFYRMAKSMRNVRTTHRQAGGCDNSAAARAMTIEELCEEKAALIKFMTAQPEILEKYRHAVAADIKKRNSKSRASTRSKRCSKTARSPPVALDGF